jgi:hypothetical protein
MPSPEDHESPEFLLERLKDVVTGDAAQRQLRRRYDALREDYETLLERVAELEDRLARPEREEPRPRGPAAAVRPPGYRPAMPAGPDEPVSNVQEGLVAPLLRLRDEYLEAVRGIQAIVQGLDGLAAASFKGQRGPEGAAAPGRAPAHERSLARETIRVDVKGSEFGQLLDFQERLSSIEGVTRVSIQAIDNERATLVVELERD